MLNYVLTRLDRALGQLEASLKDAVTDESGAFGSDLDALVIRAYRGRMSLAAFTDAMNLLLAEYIRRAYMAGLEQGGVEADEADAVDKRVIEQMIAGQRGYVGGFAAAVMEARTEDEFRPRIDDRIIFWAKSVRAAGMAGLNSAAANQVVIFGGIVGKEPDGCATCLSLMGARHRRSWFVDRGWVPGIPGNCKQEDGSGFECCGYACNHQISPVGVAVK